MCTREKKKLYMKEKAPLRPYAEQQEASYCVKHVSSFHINQACEQNVCAGRDKKRQAAQIWSLGYSSTPPPLSIHSPHFNCHCLPIATAHTVPIMTVPYNAAIALDLSFNDPPSVNLLLHCFLISQIFIQLHLPADALIGERLIDHRSFRHDLCAM